MKLFLPLFILIFAQTSWSESGPRAQGFSDAQLNEMSEHNLRLAEQERALGNLSARNTTNVLPFAEYQTTGYVVFSDDDYYGIAADMKLAIAKNLPANTTLLVYTTSSNAQYQKQLFNKYAPLMQPGQMKVLQIPSSGSNDFWSRDNLPLAVWNNSQFSLVNARYYYNFEPDVFFQNLFGVNMTAHNYFYEGGNFMGNAKGDCIVVNRKRQYPGGTSDTAAIPDEVFRNLYGCKTLTRLKHLKGIGHADEVVKFMSDSVIVTDTPEYKALLEKAGFTVVLLPEGQQDYETYINSLQVNDTIFVPSFGESNDTAVADAYKKFGLKVVTIRTDELATQGQGGIHCITMNYPPSPISQVLLQMSAKIVQE